MIKHKLDDTYKNLKARLKLYNKATRRGRVITNLGMIIILLSIFFVIPWILQTLFDFALFGSWIGGTLFGALLMVIGQQLKSRSLAPPSLSPNEWTFLNVYEGVLKNLDTYLEKEDIAEILRVEATRSLSKVEKTLTESTNGYLWKTLTKDVDDKLRLLKRNIKEIILPVIREGKREDVEKAYTVIEKLACYLLNPVISRLNELNELTSELPYRVKEKAPLLSFLTRYPKLRHIGVLFIISVSSFAVFYVGINFLHTSTDNAYIAATMFFGTLTAGYMAIQKIKG